MGAWRVLLGNWVRPHDAADADQDRYLTMDLCVPAGSAGPPPHVHKAEGETFIVLEGALTVHLNGVERVLKAHDAAHVPIGSVHTYRNDSDALVRALVIVTPGRAREFFLQASIPAPPGLHVGDACPAPDAAEIQRVLALASKYGMTFPEPG